MELDDIKTKLAALTRPQLEQLRQIARKNVWDGDLIGKGDRDALVKWGWVERSAGMNRITRYGLTALGLVDSRT